MKRKKNILPDYINPNQPWKYEDKSSCRQVIQIILMGSFFVGIFTEIIPLILIGFFSFVGIVIYELTFHKWKLDREDEIEQQIVYEKIKKEKGKKFAIKELAAYRKWYKNKYKL